MNRKHTFVATAVLLLLTALYLILRPDGSREPDSMGGNRKVSPHVSMRQGASSDATGSDCDSKEVSLPGLLPVRYSGRREMTMKQLLKKFGAIDELVPDSGRSRDIVLGQLESRADILTDDKGNLVALYRNRGMIPTESRAALAIERFRKEGVEITRMGNGVANMENRTFVLGLISFLQHYGLDRPEGTGENYQLVRCQDIVIIPVTVRVIGRENLGYRDHQEIPAIIWKCKDLYGPDNPSQSLDRFWENPSLYSESHPTIWQAIFINPTPKDGDFTKVLPASKADPYPGVCLGEILERCLPLPDE
jgi:hypothetical protein